MQACMHVCMRFGVRLYLYGIYRYMGDSNNVSVHSYIFTIHV